MKMMNKSLKAAMCAALLLLAGGAFAQTRAALIRDIDRPEAQPVNGSCTTIAQPVAGVASCLLMTVPVGKRLVVETVGYSAASGGNQPYPLMFGEGTGILSATSPNVFSLTPVLGFPVTGAVIFTATQALRIYIDEGRSLWATDTPGITSFPQNFRFSGYLVDK